MIPIRIGAVALLAATLGVVAAWRAPVRVSRFESATERLAHADPCVAPTPPKSNPEFAVVAASSDFEAAMSRILLQPQTGREAALAALFAGTADRPEALVRCATELIRRDPSLARDCGNQLLFALGTAGEHARAARFAAGAPPEFATDWLTAAYDRWGRSEPESAIANALALTEPGRRDLACRAALSGWAQTDPARLADCAINFPSGPEKTFSLVIALRAWSTSDALAASTWMRAHTAALAGVSGIEAILDN